MTIGVEYGRVEFARCSAAKLPEIVEHNESSSSRKTVVQFQMQIEHEVTNPAFPHMLVGQ